DRADLSSAASVACGMNSPSRVLPVTRLDEREGMSTCVSPFYSLENTVRVPALENSLDALALALVVDIEVEHPGHSITNPFPRAGIGSISPVARHLPYLAYVVGGDVGEGAGEVPRDDDADVVAVG